MVSSPGPYWVEPGFFGDTPCCARLRSCGLPVRGFAVVHCLGILTSMFSAVMVSRAMVNLLYGHRRRLARLAIGNTAWK